MATVSTKNERINKRKQRKRLQPHQRSQSVGFRKSQFKEKYVVPRKLGPLDMGRIKYKGTKFDESKLNYDFLEEKLDKHSRSSSFVLRKKANPIIKRPSLQEIGSPHGWKKPSFYSSESEKMKPTTSNLDFLEDKKPMHCHDHSLDALKDFHLPRNKSLHEQHAPFSWKAIDFQIEENENKQDFLHEKFWYDASKIDLENGFSHLLQSLPPEKLLLIHDITSTTPTGYESKRQYLNKLKQIVQLQLTSLKEIDNDNDNDQEITDALDEILLKQQEEDQDEEEKNEMKDEEISNVLDEILQPSPSPTPLENGKIDRKALIKQIDKNLNDIQTRNINDDKYINKIPSNFICPISKTIIQEAVMASDGRIYDKKNIENWLKYNNKSPADGQLLRHKKLMAFNELTDKINYWKMMNKKKKKKRNKKKNKKKNKSTSDLLISSPLSSSISSLSPAALSPASSQTDDTNNNININKNDTNRTNPELEIGIDSEDTS